MKKRFFNPTILLIVILILAGIIGAVAYIFFEGERPVISIHSNMEHIGIEKNMIFSVLDLKSGIKQITVSLSQGDITKQIFTKSFLREDLTIKKEKNYTINLDAKKAGFKDGKITVAIDAKDHSFKNFFGGNQSSVQIQSILDTKPPKLNILHSERYIQPGGTGIVIYKIGGESHYSGLLVGDTKHPGFLIGDGRDDVYIAYFALPYYAKDFSNTFLTATDLAGNTAKVPVDSIFKKSKFKKDIINIPDKFLSTKIPEFEQHVSGLSGTNVEKYIQINNDVREKNNAAIANLCGNPQAERMWDGKFLRMAGESKAGYADHRSYYYGGKSIDKQVHLGMDIASTRHAGIKAANKGKIIFADYLGIYGNMIIMDHGQGVFSLYSHLSQINVAVDDIIEKTAVIGQTGKSGMAGGDHLHFSMLINGVFVTPKEWWDLHWINVTIEDPIQESKF